MSQVPPPAGNWNPGYTTKPTVSWVPAMLVGATIFAVGCGSGLVAGWFGGVATNITDSLNDFDFSPADTQLAIEAPDSVTAMEPFTVTISLTETAGEFRTIDTLDIANADELQISYVEATPEPSSVDNYSYLEMSHYVTLGPNVTKDFEITLQCAQPGTHTVQVEAYFTETMAASTSFTLEVKPNLGAAGNPDF